MKMTNKVKGGKGDKKKPSDFDSEQIRMGMEIEMEHTNDKNIAMEITLDHLAEDPNYYSKLNKIIVDPVKEKMELNKEITELETQLEAMDKSKNPIEKNPTNKYNKGTTTKMDKVPKDKDNSDELECEDNKYIKTKSELFTAMESFNTLAEKKVFISDPFGAPPGVNVQVGPKGGLFYDTDLLQGSGGKQTSDKDSKKDDTKPAKKKDLAKKK